MKWFRRLVTLWRRWRFAARPVAATPDATERQNARRHMATIQRAATDLAFEVEWAYKHCRTVPSIGGGNELSCALARLLDAQRTAKNLVRLASLPPFRPPIESPRDTMVRLLATQGIEEAELRTLTVWELRQRLGDAN